MLIAAGQGRPSPLWFATRASGLVALVLLTACVVFGILITVRFASVRWPRFLTVGLHRNLSVMVLSFVIVHVITTVADSYTQIKLPDAVIPFISVYRPFWLGLGAVAFDLLLALAITSLVRLNLGHRTWRLTHWAAYACWPVAVLHGLGTGSDQRTRWVLVLTAACVLVVIWALALRLAVGWPDHAAVRVGAAVLAIVALLASGEWAQHGPLQHGWARKAGTPPPPGAQPDPGVQHGSPVSTTQAKGGQP